MKITDEKMRNAFIKLVNNMKADYPHDFNKSFGDLDSLNGFKRRIAEKLGLFDPDDVLLAYNNLAKQAKYLPNLNEIVSECIEIKKHGERQKEEMERLNCLSARGPKKTIECNPVEMLSEVEKSKKDTQSSPELYAQKLRDHDALIALHQGLGYIRRINHAAEHYCKFPGCKKMGGIGRGRFEDGIYCSEHFRMI